MNLNERISLFSSLAEVLSGKINSTHEKVLDEATLLNPWFTKENVNDSLNSIVCMLDEDTLHSWIKDYDLKDHERKDILIITAGNIPLVGFHDLLCVLICGHNAVVKFSSKDNVLMKYVVDSLITIDKRIKERIKIIDNIVDCNFDALIATGSDNSSKYFNYYFKDYKSIIRKNRRSIAILDGKESENDLKLLSKDIFMYFGLGCRNVSKLYLPLGYDTNKLFNAFFDYKDVINHLKYSNNYDYNKTVYLMNSEKLLDNGFVLLKEDQSIQSPVATVFYEFYNDREVLNKYIDDNSSLFQCIVSKDEIPFGKSQVPELNDYADQIDTVKFLQNI